MPWINIPQAPGAQRATAARNRATIPEGQARDWYTLRNATSPDEAELLLYDEIGGWWGSTAEDVIAELQGVTSPNLRVRINSPGGSVFEGIAIANALRAHAANVTVQVDSLAASIASVIAMAGDTVVMAPNSMLMIHDASGMCMGDAGDMEQMAAVLDAISDNIAGAYAAKAGGTVEDWRAAMKAESWYKAGDAVDAGLADEAMPAGAKPTDDDQQMRAAFDLVAYGYAGPAHPKPGPPPAKTDPAPAAAAPALVVSIADVLDEDTVARLRAAVAPPVVAVVEPEPAPAEPALELAEPTAAEPVDDWAASTAHLTAPAPDPWADAIAHLTTPAAPAATDA